MNCELCGVDSRGLKEPCIRWTQDRTNPFVVAMGYKLAMYGPVLKANAMSAHAPNHVTCK